MPIPVSALAGLAKRAGVGVARKLLRAPKPVQVLGGTAIVAARNPMIRRALGTAGTVGVGVALARRGDNGEEPKKKYRRMNPGNAKAVKRAIRRLEQFGRMAATLGYSKPPRKIAGFKACPPKRSRKCP